MLLQTPLSWEDAPEGFPISGIRWQGRIEGRWLHEGGHLPSPGLHGVVRQLLLPRQLRELARVHRVETLPTGRFTIWYQGLDRSRQRILFRCNSRVQQP